MKDGCDISIKTLNSGNFLHHTGYFTLVTQQPFRLFSLGSYVSCGWCSSLLVIVLASIECKISLVHHLAVGCVTTYDSYATDQLMRFPWP